VFLNFRPSHQGRRSGETPSFPLPFAPPSLEQRQRQRRQQEKTREEHVDEEEDEEDDKRILENRREEIKRKLDEKERMKEVSEPS